MPAGLADHLRYPEELFRIQTTAYSKYRLDAAAFYEREGAWSVALAPTEQPQEAGVGTSTTTTVAEEAVSSDFAQDSDAARFVPYYTMFHPTGGEDSYFAMYRPFQLFSANDQRKELASYMVASSDPATYGQLISYELPETALPDGAYTVGAAMDADETISEQATLLGRGGSRVEYGDLQMIPAGDGVIWARPFYVESSTAGQREVKFVIVEYSGAVGFGTSLASAISDIFPGFSADLGDVVAGGGEEPGEEEEPPTEETAQQLLQRAEELFNEADDALQQSPPDLATYGEKVAEARELVQQALELLEATG